MTDNVQHINLDDEAFEDAPKALREYAKTLKKALDAKTSEADGFRKQLHSKAVGDVLADKGFKNPKKVEADLLRDGIDPLDTGAVNAWLTENESDYAKGTAAPVENPVNDERSQQLAAIQNATAGAATPNSGAWDRAQAEIAAIPNPTGEQILKVYAKHGV